MSLNTRISLLARNVQLDSLRTLADNGYLKIYDGVQPADPDTVITTQNKLTELRFGSPAFGPSSGGVITANAIADDPNAALNGTATWFRVLKSDGVTPLWDGSVGTGGANLNINSAAIQQGSRVSVTALVHGLPIQGA